MRETYRIIIPYSQMNKNDSKLPSIFIISFRLEKSFDMFASAQLHKISKMVTKSFEKCLQYLILSNKSDQNTNTLFQRTLQVLQNQKVLNGGTF